MVLLDDATPSSRRASSSRRLSSRSPSLLPAPPRPTLEQRGLRPSSSLPVFNPASVKRRSSVKQLAAFADAFALPTTPSSPLPREVASALAAAAAATPSTGLPSLLETGFVVESGAWGASSPGRLDEKWELRHPKLKASELSDVRAEKWAEEQEQRARLARFKLSEDTRAVAHARREEEEEEVMAWVVGLGDRADALRMEAERKEAAMHELGKQV